VVGARYAISRNGQPNIGMHPTANRAAFIRQLGCLFQLIAAGDAGRYAAIISSVD